MTPFARPLDAEALCAKYPERDGNPMSDNMKQGRWISLLYGNLCALLADREDAFVAADNLWYPVEGRPDLRQAPDVYVAFARPKGDRGSYMQWLEDDVPLTVVFEILSPANSDDEMARKHLFYDQYGVEEYYVYDPDRNTLQIYTRGLATLRRHRDIAKFVSPRLGIRFEVTRPEMTVYGPDGERFVTFEELDGRYEEEKERREEAERQVGEARRLADDNARRAEAAVQANARLKELSRKARLGQATPEEVAELDRLEGETA